jgi:hypothetical protein
VPCGARVGGVVHDDALIPRPRGTGAAQTHVELHKLRLRQVQVLRDELTTTRLQEEGTKRAQKLNSLQECLIVYLNDWLLDPFPCQPQH